MIQRLRNWRAHCLGSRRVETTQSSIVWRMGGWRLGHRVETARGGSRDREILWLTRDSLSEWELWEYCRIAVAGTGDLLPVRLWLMRNVRGFWCSGLLRKHSSVSCECRGLRLQRWWQTRHFSDFFVGLIISNWPTKHSMLDEE